MCISLAHCLGESLSLDYENIYPSHDQDAVELGVRYDGACSHFVVEAFTRQDIIDGGSSVSGGHNSTVDSSAVNVSLDVLNQTQPANYVRIVAASEDGDICSDGQSQQSFYHFAKPGNDRGTHCPAPSLIGMHKGTRMFLTMPDLSEFHLLGSAGGSFRPKPSMEASPPKVLTITVSVCL